MDLSTLSDADLIALNNNEFDKLSDQGLITLDSLLNAPKQGLIDYGGPLGDISTAAAKGIVSAGQGLVGLADIPTGGAAGKWVEQNVADLEALKKHYGEYYSPETQQSLQAVEEAQGVGGTLEIGRAHV